MDEADWVVRLVDGLVKLRGSSADRTVIEQVATNAFSTSELADPQRAAADKSAEAPDVGQGDPALPLQKKGGQRAGRLRKLVLVADDHDHVATLVAKLLRLSKNYEAVAVEDGEGAIRHALEFNPDAALLDVDMAKIGGIEVARKIREVYGCDAPLLIAWTGGSNFDAAVLSGHFDHVLRKPISVEEVSRLLERLP